MVLTKAIHNDMTPQELEIIYQQIVRHRDLYKNGATSTTSTIYPYYYSFSDLIVQVCHLKYISNSAFLLMVFAYFVGAYQIFEIFLPITLSNCFVILAIIIGESKKVLYGSLGNKTFKKLPIKVKNYIIDRDINTVFPFFIITVFVSHLLMVIVAYLLYTNYTTTSPNFLGVYGLSILIVSGFIFVVDKKLYGDINEPFYMCIYIATLFVINYYLYSE